MITIKSAFAQEKMRIAGRLLAELCEELKDIIKPGVSTLAIDTYIDAYLKKHKMISSTRGYLGYKHVCCISVNDEVVHGIPQEAVKIKEGDLVKVDICASYDGYCADMARPYFMGTPPSDIASFIETAQKALDAGIHHVRVGEQLGNVSAAIQEVTEKKGYGIVREFAGHGIGKKMHEDPEILNYGKRNTGPVMKAGMAFAIEPMITMGNGKVYVHNDGWTVKTMDKTLAAHVEDTVLVQDNGPQIITRI